jgi:hypothetical protein
VQQGPELFPAGGVEGDAEPMGPRGALAERGGAPGVERGDGVPDGLGITAQVAGDRGGLLAPGTGEQDLGPTVDEGVGRAQASHQLGALGVRHGTHVHGMFHTT